MSLPCSCIAGLSQAAEPRHLGACPLLAVWAAQPAFSANMRGTRVRHTARERFTLYAHDTCTRKPYHASPTALLYTPTKNTQLQGVAALHKNQWVCAAGKKGSCRCLQQIDKYHHHCCCWFNLQPCGKAGVARKAASPLDPQRLIGPRHSALTMKSSSCQNTTNRKPS